MQGGRSELRSEPGQRIRAKARAHYSVIARRACAEAIQNLIVLKYWIASLRSQ
jgi:hypothetical protein